MYSTAPSWEQAVYATNSVAMVVFLRSLPDGCLFDDFTSGSKSRLERDLPRSRGKIAIFTTQPPVIP